MAWWLASRRVWLVGVAVVVVVLGQVVGGGRAMPTPLLVGEAGTTLWSSLLLVVWAVVCADAFATRTQAVEARAGRRLAVADLCFFWGTTALAALTYAGLGASTYPDGRGITVGEVGQVLVAAGAAVTLTLVAGPVAAALVFSVAFVVSTAYGVNGPCGPYLRLLQPDGDPGWTFAVGVVLCLIASGLLAAGRVVARLRAGALAV